MTTTASNFSLILHVQSAEMNLRDLATCSEEMERMLEREQSRLRTQVRKRGSRIEDDELRAIYFENAAEEWNQVSRTFPAFFRSAFFAKSISAFETYLLKAAEAHRSRTGILLALGDLRGDGISKAKLFFTKVARLPFPSEAGLWSDLEPIQGVRLRILISRCLLIA